MSVIVKSGSYSLLSILSLSSSPMLVVVLVIPTRISTIFTGAC